MGKSTCNSTIYIEGLGPKSEDLGEGAWGWYTYAQGRLEVYNRDGTQKVVRKVQVGEVYQVRINGEDIKLDEGDLPKSKSAKLGHLLGCNKKRRANYREKLQNKVDPEVKTRRVKGKKFELLVAIDEEGRESVYAMWADEEIDKAEILELIPYMTSRSDAYNKVWLHKYLDISEEQYEQLKTL